jgi:transcription initiation factor TFIIIB Brf1 subunit/transcription initiation factor TFIIB
MKEEQKKECQECGSTNVIYDKEKDELICQACGAVFAELEPKKEKEFEEAHDQE